jgi:hypothetical protein
MRPIYLLFNDIVSNSGDIVLNYKMISEKWIGVKVEESVDSLIKFASQSTFEFNEKPP